MKKTNTNINWITVPDTNDGEWCTYKKSFVLDSIPQNAIIRFESDCVCAVFVNGEFIISGTGRYPERVNCNEITSKLLKGENTVEIKLGGHYFQKFAFETKEKRGYWLNQAALELSIISSDGSIINIPTDDSWQVEDSAEKPVITMQVTEAEYETMWKNAAFWQNTEKYVPYISDEVLTVAGEEYKEYANEKSPKTIPCQKVVSTNMESKDGTYTVKNNEDAYIIFDMGRIAVGYFEFDYNCTGKVSTDYLFDYTESTEDFESNAEFASTIERLSISEELDSEKHFYRNLRRRAFRYIKITFKGELENFNFSLPRVRLCLFPVTQKGWFNCSDEMLNTAWEMGKYTLHVNKQQEYESCPRREMLFFAGDGVIDAQIDIYAFGNCDMLNTALSLKHEISAIGISNTTKFNRTVWQWDYFAWRIICIYNYYCHTGDIEFLKRHYEEAKYNILWLTERMNDKDLLFQIPAFHSTFSSTMIQVDWACSIHRLGENAFLNCLLYKSLVCMAELGADMEDESEAEEWKSIAERVKKAINTYLWDDSKKAYVDGISDYICQDANALAIIFDVADDKRAAEALKTLKNTLWSPYGSVMASKEFDNDVLRGGNITISPMMSAHEAEAWFKIDKAEQGLELIRRVWGTMLKKGATTFWEFSPNNGEDKWEAPCHAWSAGCTYLLSAFVLGVRPIESNWKKFIFAPRPCDLEWGKGVVPTPSGLIAVSWKKEEGICKFTVAMPKNIEIETDIPECSTVEIIKY